MDTREMILDSALRLFSERGYDSVSIEDITEEVGIKPPSLYKHFESKQDLFDTLIKELTLDLDKRQATGSIGKDPESDAKVVQMMSDAVLVTVVTGFFHKTVFDEDICGLRKMLSLQQYRSVRAADLLNKMYYDGPLMYLENIFKELIRMRSIKAGDARAMAVEFYAPFQLMIDVCDRQPERADECGELLEAHILAFAARYRAV